MNPIINRQGIAFQIDTNLRENFPTERNDCTVRALKTAAGVPYSDAHAVMARLGRSNRKGMIVPMLDEMTKMTHVYGYKVTKVADHKSGLTLGRAVMRYRTGRFYLVITGHAIGMINGVVVDGSTSGSRCRIKAIYKFESSTEVEAREKAQGGF